MTNPEITTFLMCPTSSPTTAGGTPQVNEGAGGHIRKAAANGNYVVRAEGWTHVFDAASVVLVELVRLAHLVPANSGDESPDRCKKEVFVTGAHQSTECADEDQHEGNDKGLRAHGLGRLEFEPKGALIATRLGPERAIGQTLDLKLSFVGGVLVPLGDGSRLDAQQRSKGASGPGMVNSGLSFHDGR